MKKIKNLLLEYHPESEELKKVIKYCNQVEKEIIYEKETKSLYNKQNRKGNAKGNE